MLKEVRKKDALKGYKFDKFKIFLISIIIFFSHSVGWRLTHHIEMTRDALGALALPKVINVDSIANYADNPDYPWFWHPRGSCHRVRIYQDIFEKYGGSSCKHPGAEIWALHFLNEARISFERGDIKNAEKHLGYAIHYIQDAVCLPHVFPFKERLLSGPHWNFEGYAENKYLHDSCYRWWRDRVKTVRAKKINSSNLEEEIKKAAKFVHKFKIIFLANDGQWYQAENENYSESKLKRVRNTNGWYATDEQICQAMECAAAIVKGAAIYVFSQPREESIWELLLSIISSFFEKKLEELGRYIERKMNEQTENMEEEMEREIRECCAVQSVYGSALTSDLNMLRDFRDNTLSKNVFGKILINYYYKLSPLIFMVVSKYPSLRPMVRETVVKPVIAIVKIYYALKNG